MSYDWNLMVLSHFRLSKKKSIMILESRDEVTCRHNIVGSPKMFCLHMNIEGEWDTRCSVDLSSSTSPAARK